MRVQVEAAAAVPEPVVHPIYGELVKDLIYKKGAASSGH
jgi:hypothetical protein